MTRFGACSREVAREIQWKAENLLEAMAGLIAGRVTADLFRFGCDERRAKRSLVRLTLETAGNNVKIFKIAETGIPGHCYSVERQESSC